MAVDAGGGHALRCRHWHLELGRDGRREWRARCRDGLRRRRADTGNTRRRRPAAQGAARVEDPRRQRRRPHDAATQGAAPARFVRSRLRRPVHARQAGDLRLSRLSLSDPPADLYPHQPRRHARPRLCRGRHHDDAVRHGRAQRARPLSPRDRGDRARAGARDQGGAGEAAIPRQADRAFALCARIRRGHAGNPGMGLAEQRRRQHAGGGRRLTAAMLNTVLVLNSGSSSIKFGLFEISAAEPTPLCKGLLDEHETKPRLVVKSPAGEDLFQQGRESSDADSDHLFADMLGFIDDRFGDHRLRAVGHRVVHGGPDYSAPVELTDDVTAKLEALTPLAPLHQPRCLAPVRAISAIRPDLTQIACFDTAFHHGIAPPASRFAIPRRYEERGVRRYGFHGLSFEYVAGRLAKIAPQFIAKRTIIAHLGNGASLCALRDGRSVDTTMGLTPLDGLVMGTRCGRIDPGVLLYLQQYEKMSVEDVQHLLYHESGLLGVSCIASDMRTLLASREAAAREAVELFTFRAAQEVAAMAI